MSDSEFQRRIESAMEEAYNKRRDFIVQGFAQDHSDYRYSIGYLQAFTDIGEIIKDVSAGLYGVIRNPEEVINEHE